MIDGEIRAGKIMLYSPDTGKRIKEPFNHINWVHAVKDKDGMPLFPGFNLRQCFFGEHLLKSDKIKPVAIVESEKTAILASVCLPQFIWLACGSMQGINVDKLKALGKRKIILCPDLKCERWGQIAQGLRNVRIFHLLDELATKEEREQGLDLADYLIRCHNFFPGQTGSLPANQPPTSTLSSSNHLFATSTQAEPAQMVPHSVSTVHCFEGRTGKVYVQKGDEADRYAVFSSVECYNKHSAPLEYFGAPIAMQDFGKELFIDFSCLMIK